MKKNYRLLTVILLSLSLGITVAVAQNSIVGRIVDVNGVPISYAVLMLLNSEGKHLNAHSTTDSLGFFSFKSVPAAEYLLKTQCLGYKEHSLSCDLRQNHQLRLGDIRLEEETTHLGALVVKGYRSRPMLRVVGGKLEVSVAESYLGGLENALEVLQSTPTVRVSRTGEITLSSLGGVAIYLNNRRIRLSGEALASYLRSLPASSILRIETTISPGAEYESEGSGGIINIVTRSKHAEGLFASVTQGFSYWEHFRANTNLNLTYTHGPWSLACIYSQALGHYNMSYGHERKDKDERSYSQTIDTDKRNSYSSTIDIGYTPSNQHRFLLNISGNLHAGPGITETQTRLYNKFDQLVYTLLSKNDYQRQRNLRYGTGLSYQFIPSERHKLSTTLDWINFSSGAACLQPNTYIHAGTNLTKHNDFRSENSRHINIYALTADYAWTPSEQHTLKFGNKSSLVESRNDFIFQNHDRLDTQRSNKFAYDEHSAEVYALYSYAYGAWQATLGVRAEWLRSKGKLTPYKPNTVEEEHKLERTNLFPSASLNYKSNLGTYSIAYTRRQDKPRYEDLNPFEYLLDELMYWRGNPFLRPQINNQVTINANFGRLNLATSYQYLQDYFTNITDAYHGNTMIMTTKNLGARQLLSFEGIYTARPIPRWNLTLQAGVYYTWNKLQYETYLERYSSPSGMISCSNSLQLPWDLKLELSARYYSRRLDASYQLLQPTGALEGAIHRSFLDNRLNISLLMTDILHSEHWNSSGKKGNLQLNIWGHSESRQLRLSLRYTLGRQSSISRHTTPDAAERL